MPSREQSPEPRKRRALQKSYSDEKTAQPRRRLAPVQDAAPKPVAPRLKALLSERGVPPEGLERLLPLLADYGEARVHELLGLWTFLGDGGFSRGCAVSALQVVGPAGSGKSELLSAFLGAMEVRHVRLNGACFAAAAELQGRLVEEVRRLAVAEAEAAGVTVPQRLKKSSPGQMVRALDKLEQGLQPALELLPGRLVLVLERAEELPRLGAGLLPHLLRLPESLTNGGRITVVAVSRLPLSLLGVLPAREPASVEFAPYTPSQAEEILERRLSGARSAPELRTLVSSGLCKLAAPALGWNLSPLLSVGEELLSKKGATSGSVAALQRRVEAAVAQRAGLCDLSRLGDRAANATVQRLTDEEKRLLLAAYLGSRVEKQDDAQLFLPEGRRRAKRRGGAVTKAKEGLDAELPAFARAPQPVALPRLLAIYHRLARQPQLLSPLLLERLMGLREAGLLRFAGEKPACCEKEVKVLCRAEAELARACAADLGVDLAEFLGER